MTAPKSKSPESPLVASAQAFDETLKRFAALISMALMIGNISIPVSVMLGILH